MLHMYNSSQSGDVRKWDDDGSANDLSTTRVAILARAIRTSSFCTQFLMTQLFLSMLAANDEVAKRLTRRGRKRKQGGREVNKRLAERRRVGCGWLAVVANMCEMLCSTPLTLSLSRATTSSMYVRTTLCSSSSSGLVFWLVIAYRVYRIPQGRRRAFDWRRRPNAAHDDLQPADTCYTRQGKNVAT